MTGLQRRLASAASVYDDLLEASLPGRSGEPSGSTPDPRDKPVPGSLSVLDHRHDLVRLLRWWVDAVHEHGERTARMGSDVPAMARYLAAHVHVMADEDAGTLYGRLGGWLVRAAGMMGEPTSAPIVLEGAQLDQRVRVADAARLLGCTVRTVQRRVPADQRQDGMVRLLDAVPRCELCDLPEGQCPHTVRVTVAQ